MVEQLSDQVARANASGKTPVVFIHGLWLLPSSWDRWAEMFEAAGYVAVQPRWPDELDTVAEANARPEVLAGKSVGQIAGHLIGIVKTLEKKPAVIGHSFGGLFAQIVAGQGLSAVTRHSLVIDRGWKEVADTAFGFVRRFA